MTESAYTLVCSSVQIKDPKVLTKNSDLSSKTADKYILEVSDTTQTDEKFGIIKTIYHSQLFFTLSNSNGFQIPFWQKQINTASAETQIGKIILKIKNLNKDNSSNTQLFQLISTQKSASEIDATLETASFSTASNAAINNSKLGAGANSYSFYIPGSNGTSDTVSKIYEIDFNNNLKAKNASTSFIALGLQTSGTPTSESAFYVEAYVETIETNDEYPTSHSFTSTS